MHTFWVILSSLWGLLGAIFFGLGVFVLCSRSNDFRGLTNFVGCALIGAGLMTGLILWGIWG